MTKIIITLIIGPIIAISALLGFRYTKNVPSVVPYPYVFAKNAYQDLELDAPILIIGDRLGKRLSTFSEQISKKISENLSKPIKVQSLALDGEGLHRTLKKVKSLKKLPLILIYLGGSQEEQEHRFRTEDIPTIDKNLMLFEDHRIQSALMVFPIISSFIYSPVNYVELGKSIQKNQDSQDHTGFLKRSAISFKLFEREIEELFTYTKDHGSYMIAVSSPINLDSKPKASCEGSLGEELRPKFQEVLELVKKRDFKQVYNTSQELALLANTNAQSLYLHGQIAKNLGKMQEAKKYLELSAAYDCKSWRTNPVYNTILERAAAKHDIAFYDFNKMLKDHYGSNIVFFDDIFPQNLYMERMASAIGMKIKKLLKL